MGFQYTYKLQGNGLDSWKRESNTIQDMVYDIEVSTWKLKVVLNQLNLLNQIDNILEQLPEPNKTIANIAWKQSPTVSITSSLTKIVQQQLNLTIQEVTSIFQSAENLDI